MLLFVIILHVDLLSRTFVYSTHGKEAGVWLDWECSRNCSDSRRHRKRFCPVIADCRQENQTIESDCYVGKKCPSDCPPLSWGPGCNQYCFRCAKDCDKFTGNCVACKKGFKNPNQGCNRRCGPYEYGTDCAGDCKKKCKGEDCYDRVNGSCIVNGRFGMWGQWTCLRDCESREQIRHRHCNDPEPANGGQFCFGDHVNQKFSPCNVGIKCPEDCKDYEWGYRCNDTCYDCMSPCDKVDGSCVSCKAGFKGTGCKIECGQFEYGINCLGDCRLKCSGQDCLERLTGDCKIHYLKYIPLVLSLLMVPICLYWCLGPKDTDLDFDFGEEEESVFKPETSLHGSALTQTTQGVEMMSDVDEGTSTEMYKSET